MKKGRKEEKKKMLNVLIKIKIKFNKKILKNGKRLKRKNRNHAFKKTK